MSTIKSAICPRIGGYKGEFRHVRQHIRIDSVDSISGLMIMEMGAIGVKAGASRALLEKWGEIRTTDTHPFDKIGPSQGVHHFIRLLNHLLQFRRPLGYAAPCAIAFPHHVEIEHSIDLLELRRHMIGEIRRTHQSPRHRTAQTPPTVWV